MQGFRISAAPVSVGRIPGLRIFEGLIKVKPDGKNICDQSIYKTPDPDENETEPKPKRGRKG